jgi:phosphatidylserine/phosphatidylglycerophosphate/cardiolipin synthase-like enzyme
MRDTATLLTYDAKTAVIDGNRATIGTAIGMAIGMANMDYRSFLLNYELQNSVIH